MAEPVETLRRPKEEKTPEEKRKEFKVIKGGGRKRWGPGAKAGAIAVSTTAVVSGVAAALGETDNLPDPLQGFYDQAFHPGKVAEEKSDQTIRGKYDVEEANEDFAKIVNETQKETPPVVEETPEEIEWEEMTITPMEGLRFNKGTFYAEAGNPYGLEVGEKAGVAVPNAVEINGVMESAIGLRPEVIEVMQKKIMEEEKEFRYPLPFNLEQAKGIKIREVKNERMDEWTKNDGIFWDSNFGMEISNVPLGTIIYSPITTLGGEHLLWNNDISRNDYYVLLFSTDPSLLGEKLLRGKERIDGWPQINIEAIGIKLLPEGIEKKITSHEKDGSVNFFRTEAQIGVPVAKVVTQEYLDYQYWDKKNTPIDITNEPSILIDCQIVQYKDSDKSFIDPSEDFSKFLATGLENLLKLGEEEIIVFISTAK